MIDEDKFIQFVALAVVTVGLIAGVVLTSYLG